MINPHYSACLEIGFPNIKYIKDGISKNDPNNSSCRSTRPLVKFDEDFFNGKYVLLFDDIVTKGTTMSYYRDILKYKGANVVGGICIGQTKHSVIYTTDSDFQQ